MAGFAGEEVGEKTAFTFLHGSNNIVYTVAISELHDYEFPSSLYFWGIYFSFSKMNIYGLYTAQEIIFSIEE